MEERLRNASIDELRDFLRGRFQEKGPWAADTGTRESEFPYDLPLELWRGADETLRRRITQATRDLVGEVPGEGWSADAVAWFAAFIDRADMVEAIPALQLAAEQGRWSKAPDDGPRCHMVALRTLLGLGWKGTPAFWHELPEEIAKRYPALAFRGLLAHDPTMESAFAHLPSVVGDEAGVMRIIDVLSPLVRRASTASVRQKLRSVFPKFTEDVQAEFQKWFDVHGWGSIAVEDTLP
jgi:hypothetical protein